MANKIKIGNPRPAALLPIVRCEFWDHVHEEADPENAAPIKCEVFGVLWKEDSLSYYISSWICNQEIFNNNTETFVVLKSTVIDLKKLG